MEVHTPRTVSGPGCPVTNSVAPGSVLFGGIDTQKFSGPLVERQMALHPIMQASLKSPGEALDDRRTSGAEPSTVVVSFDKLVITAADGTILPATEGKPLLASLDSSYTISYLPAPVAERITERFPSAQRHESAARDGSVYYTVDCDAAQLKGSLDFVLGDTTIKLPFEDLVGSKVNSESCFLGVASQPTGTFYCSNQRKLLTPAVVASSLQHARLNVKC